jgi:CheY-like chemotaxis protein
MYKVLVVEDEKNIRYSIQEILLFKEYEVTLAENGLVGLQILKRQKFDLVLCDVMMPEMNGFELLETLKKDETFNTPFIFLTAKAQYEDLRMGMNLGADDYIFKPFKSKDLITAIESRISKKDRLIGVLINKSQELEKTIELMVGHEFNTPMNGILSFSKMIRENAQKWDDQELVNFCDYLDKSSQRLHQTFQKVKLLLELQGGAQIHQTTANKFDTDKIIVRVSKNIAIKAERADDLEIKRIENIQTSVDEELFSILLSEIIENAFKFSNQGTKISVQAEQKEDTYIIHITDSGTKIKAEELRRYESFTQFNRNKYEQQGLGTGLAIAKSIIGLYKGEIIFTDNIPTGICVALKLKL